MHYGNLCEHFELNFLLHSRYAPFQAQVFDCFALLCIVFCFWFFSDAFLEMQYLYNYDMSFLYNEDCHLSALAI